MDRHPFALENLESRTLYSVVTPLAAGPVTTVNTLLVAPHLVAVTVSPIAGAFNVAGTYTHPIGPIGNPDAGAQYDFKGTGKTKSLGSFTVTGHLTGPGFIANGQASGRLAIRTSHGIINLIVQGPPQTPGALPTTLSYKIASGTGSYVNRKGKGQIIVSASDTTHKFVFRFNQ
jgi:hypothetical protein